jgi:hypothetical protein
MGKKSTPDYEGAAKATAESDAEMLDKQTIANRPNQINPWGEIQWSQDADGNWTQRQTLTDDSQSALDSQLDLQRQKSELAGGMMGKAGDSISADMDWTKFEDYGRAPDAYNPQEMNNQGMTDVGGIDQSNLNQLGTSGEIRRDAEDATYERSMARLEPQIAQEKEALEVSLRNRGLTEGDAAFDSAMGNFDQKTNDAMSSARNDSIRMGGEEASRNFGIDSARRGQMFGEGQDTSQNEMMRRQQEYQERMGMGGYNRQGQNQQFNQGMQGANYQNQLRNQQINEEKSRRSQYLNELNSLLTGQQVNSPTFDGFNQAGRSQGVDYSGALKSSTDFDQAQNQMLMDGVTGMGGAAMGMFSDRRLKTNIEQIGVFKGYPLYEYDYIWGAHGIGCMSDEINQEAVTVTPSGFDFVDYNKIH